MGKTDRCVLCDYTEAGGSPSIQVKPNEHGRVRKNRGEHFCERCLDEIGENLFSISQDDDEPVEADASTVPVRYE